MKDPAVIVIFGATGDLTARKLFPSLYTLHQNGLLSEGICIVGVSRSQYSHEAFREAMRKSVAENGGPGMKMADWPSVSQRIFYQSVTSDDPDSFRRLKSFLTGLDATFAGNGNRLFYMALPPTMYKSVAYELHQAGMAAEDPEKKTWVRLVVEKPFGRDLETALDLDRALHEGFSEHQIFRIDHYLAKETVQNILMFRFANAIFEPVWNRRYIDSVTITAAEQLGVEHRAGYYEQFGVLRDMFQNHMMQLMALCAMEPPSAYAAERVRDEKTKVYRALRPFPVQNLDDYLVLGQYAAGRINETDVPGYREEPNVAADSLTPTFAAMKVFIDNWRWQGVPFYLISGKRLAEKRTGITVRFKDVPTSLFREVIEETIPTNMLTLGIYPKEEIYMDFQTKVPGPEIRLRTARMHFDYGHGQKAPVADAYEKALLDCLAGDHTLFWRQDGVELCWRFLTPILEECECPERGERLHSYKAGTWGPEAFQQMVPETFEEVGR